MVRRNESSTSSLLLISPDDHLVFTTPYLTIDEIPGHLDVPTKCERGYMDGLTPRLDGRIGLRKRTSLKVTTHTCQTICVTDWLVLSTEPTLRVVT